MASSSFLVLAFSSWYSLYAVLVSGCGGFLGTANAERCSDAGIGE